MPRLLCCLWALLLVALVPCRLEASAIPAITSAEPPASPASHAEDGPALMPPQEPAPVAENEAALQGVPVRTVTPQTSAPIAMAQARSTEPARVQAGPAAPATLTTPPPAASPAVPPAPAKGHTTQAAEHGGTDNTEDAAARISGFTTPGIIEHILQRPEPGAEEHADGGPVIHFTYPSVGHDAVDADIRQWVTGIADTFSAHLDTATLGLLNGEQAISFELWASYRVERPSRAAVSVIFDIWNYTGGQQGNEDVMTLNYSLLTGQRLSLVDIFEHPQKALELMSAWSRQVLQGRFGMPNVSHTLQDGTAPLTENFASFALIPDGLRIYFQPFQVASGSLGVQYVDMPLEALSEAAPLPVFWGL